MHGNRSKKEGGKREEDRVDRIGQDRQDKSSRDRIRQRRVRVMQGTTG
jgi:hypothetical protein